MDERTKKAIKNVANRGIPSGLICGEKKRGNNIRCPECGEMTMTTKWVGGISGKMMNFPDKCSNCGYEEHWLS